MDGLYMENPTKMDDLGVPLFLETSIYPLYSTGCIVGYQPSTVDHFFNIETLVEDSADPVYIVVVAYWILQPIFRSQLNGWMDIHRNPVGLDDSRVSLGYL